MAYSDYVRVEWNQLPEEAIGKLITEYGVSIQSAIYQVVKSWSPLVEAWMKDNAPWTDRTGDARAGLTARSHLVFNQYVILRLSHTVEYGTYLEGFNPLTNSPMNNVGTWSIIEPALDYFGPKIMRDIQSRLL